MSSSARNGQVRENGRKRTQPFWLVRRLLRAQATVGLRVAVVRAVTGARPDPMFQAPAYHF
jgi:hypothetical protein